MYLGNDIIDLTDPETWPGATHPRFVARVLSAAERRLMSRVADPNRYLWKLWAAKESAFKAFRKVFPRLRFIPANINLSLPYRSDRHIIQLSGILNSVYAIVRFEEDQDHVHAVASLWPSDGTAIPFSWRAESGVRRLPAFHGVAPFVSVPSGENGCGCLCPGTASPTEAGRRFLIQRLAQLLRLAPEDLSFTDAPSRGLPPTLLIRGQRSPIDLSLSHHGGLVAFAFRHFSLELHGRRV